MTNYLIVFYILAILYLAIVGGLLYLSYRYIKYINKLEETKCKCSEDTKRDMIKNFSYLILVSWALLIFVLMFVPPKTIKLVDNKFLSLINFIIIAVYGFLLFFYSKKLIEESCKCSESWVRDSMQYQSYVYIGLSITSIIIFLIKLLIGNDKRAVFKLINAFKK